MSTVFIDISHCPTNFLFFYMVNNSLSDISGSQLLVTCLHNIKMLTYLECVVHVMLGNTQM